MDDPRVGRMGRILIIGGYGAFGYRVAERLARETDLDIVLAGRREAAARTAVARLRPSASAPLSAAAIDVETITAADIGRLAPVVVVNASGPFQHQDYRLAEACIAAGVHYVDLADARAFVTGIGRLDAVARSAGLSVISGASTVPALSSAVGAHLAGDFDRLDSIAIAISPGNSFDPGEATTASILSYVGKPFTTRIDGRAAVVHGWQGLARGAFPMLGARWLGDVNVPDLDLLVQRYPGVASVRVRAGVEVAPFHLGLWALSWLVRIGAVRDTARLARPLLAVKRRLSFLGSDRGGMTVTLAGDGRDGRQLQRRWHLAACSGHGPYVPAIASVILARALARGDPPFIGARPCVQLFPLGAFEAELADLDIRTGIA